MDSELPPRLNASRFILEGMEGHQEGRAGLKSSSHTSHPSRGEANATWSHGTRGLSGQALRCGGSISESCVVHEQGNDPN
ncbi:hypothetical protein EYF80_047982 [Liparis tanakae]|uniref:Uncharacterized protein n=1 Tax=Liparis tanakae TaxID=230148 RepID=A0A4Z2FKT0_9TELE|nr:hypothetical protein EYF80_047982 [Liparis tanakae]